jgi:predicted Rossmann fold flavoprotein
MKIIIAGGGPAGFFAAINAKLKNPSAEVTILEKSDKLLEKVFLSGGKRCNLSNAIFEPAKLCNYYPRGHKELLQPFYRFNPRNTIAWFKSRGIPIKTEPDGRIFPMSNHSQTIVDSLIHVAEKADVKVLKNCELIKVNRSVETGNYSLELTDDQLMHCDKLLLATGGSAQSAGVIAAAALGHTIIEQIPSLFTFTVSDKRITTLPGVSLSNIAISIPGTKFKERGALLITHTGFSGPAILKLSAFAARDLFIKNYQFTVVINWVPDKTQDKTLALIVSQRQIAARQKIHDRPPFPFPIRLWQSLAEAAGCKSAQFWADLSKAQANDLAMQICKCTFAVTGKNSNKGEFVTCGGVNLSEINFDTMESRKCSGLYFAGEILDIDGVTGGFNLQAAWTTGFIAGESMAV